MEIPQPSNDAINAEILPCLPLELIENLIILYSAVSWLRVSKKYNKLATKHAVNDPLFLEAPDFAVSHAASYKNYALLDALLADQRYTESSILSHAVTSDRIASTLFLRHCMAKNLWMKRQVLSAAVREDWPEVVEYIFNCEDKNILTLEFECMSEEVFNFVIQHPKLKWSDISTVRLLKNTKIPESAKLKILALPDTNLQLVISRFQNTTFLDGLEEDQRVLSSTNLQAGLWTRIIEFGVGLKVEYDLYYKLKTILEKKLLDPSVDYNLPLRNILDNYHLLSEEKRKLAQLLLDDDRVTLTLEPLDKNLIIVTIKNTKDSELIEQIKWILNQPKFNREWFEIIAKHLLFDQLKNADYNTRVIDPEFIFKEHQFDEYLSEEIRAKYPRVMKPFERFYRKREAFLDGEDEPDSDNSYEDIQ